jgi:hypothetical protein
MKEGAGILGSAPRVPVPCPDEPLSFWFEVTREDRLRLHEPAAGPEPVRRPYVGKPAFIGTAAEQIQELCGGGRDDGLGHDADDA